MHEVEHGRLKADEARHNRPKALHWVVEVACLGIIQGRNIIAR